MTKPSGIAQFFLRLALGIGFILPVMDRLGWLGLPGTGNVNWGDWAHFVDYTHSLVPFVSRFMAGALGGLATVAEIVFGICLIIGYQVRSVALGSAILTFIFGICMATSAGIGAPFNYPVFVFTGAGLVLAERKTFRWSVDRLLAKTQAGNQIRVNAIAPGVVEPNVLNGLSGSSQGVKAHRGLRGIHPLGRGRK